MYLKNSQLPKKVFAEALNYAVYISNFLFNKSLGITSYKKYTGNKPNISKLKSFGVHVLVYDDRKNEREDKAIKKIFFGFSNKTIMNYRTMDLDYSSVTLKLMYILSRNQMEGKRF